MLFETSDHNVLIRKLIKYEFDINSIRWMQSYIRNRRHIIKCAWVCSKEVSVNYGIPQGSVLGPLCFILNVNDLITGIINNTQARIIIYADDTVLLTESSTPALATDYMQNTLDCVSTWCTLNKMTVNTNKTKHILGLRNKKLFNKAEALTVNFDDVSLSNVSSYKESVL